MEKLFDGEYKLMEILWQTGAVNSARLVELCAQRLGWNKSTTYTVLRRLKNKGTVDHRDTVVTPLLTRMAAFFGGRKLTPAEAEELKELIDRTTWEG